MIDDPLLKDAERRVHEGVECPIVANTALVRQLGAGGIGTVYLGQHLFLHQFRAVKVLRPETFDGHPSGAERFLQEARLAASVRSDHVVTMFDAGLDDTSGLFYIAMEYVHGKSADDWVRGNSTQPGRISERAALSVCISAAAGIAAAHDCGIVHRDVKSGNILIPEDDDGKLQHGGAKVADLGLARSTADTARKVTPTRITQAAITMGTPGYMAPEQIRDARSAGAPADVFGLACTLYEMLTGVPPFVGAAWIAMTLDGSYKSLSAARPGVSAILEDVVIRALKPDPDDRYADANEFLLALEPCLDPSKKSTTPIVVDLPPTPSRAERRPTESKRRVTTDRSPPIEVPATATQRIPLVSCFRSAWHREQMTRFRRECHASSTMRASVRHVGAHDSLSQAMRAAASQSGPSVVVTHGFLAEEIASAYAEFESENAFVVGQVPRGTRPDQAASASSFGPRLALVEDGVVDAVRKAVLRMRAASWLTIRRIKEEDELDSYFNLRYRAWSKLGYMSATTAGHRQQWEVNYTDRLSVPIGAFTASGRIAACARLVNPLGREVAPYRSIIDGIVRSTADQELIEAWEFPERLSHPFDLLESFEGFPRYYRTLVTRKLKRGEVSRVIVEPECRSIGLGEVLVDSLVTIANWNSYAVLFLAARRRHQGFYERCGFERLGDYTCDRFVRIGVPAIAMERRLLPGRRRESDS